MYAVCRMVCLFLTSFSISLLSECKLHLFILLNKITVVFFPHRFMLKSLFCEANLNMWLWCEAQHKTAHTHTHTYSQFTNIINFNLMYTENSCYTLWRTNVCWLCMSFDSFPLDEIKFNLIEWSFGWVNCGRIKYILSMMENFQLLSASLEKLAITHAIFCVRSMFICVHSFLLLFFGSCLVVWWTTLPFRFFFSSFRLYFTNCEKNEKQKNSNQMKRSGVPK